MRRAHFLYAALRHGAYAGVLIGLLFLMDSPTLERFAGSLPEVGICVSRSGQVIVDLPSKFPFALWPADAVGVLTMIENDETGGSTVIHTGSRAITLTPQETRYLERFLPPAIEEARRIENQRQALAQR